MMTQAELNISLTPFSAKEIKRWQFRYDLFVKRRLSIADAGYWADRLALRDQERDDRRVCFECKNLRDGGRCRVKEAYVTILQRCPGFEWETP